MAPKKMTLAEFDAGNPSRTRTGLRAWIIALPVGVPTLFPDGLTASKTPQPNITNEGRASGLRVSTRRIDGQIWVVNRGKR